MAISATNAFVKGLPSWARGGSREDDPRQKPVEVGVRELPNAEVRKQMSYKASLPYVMVTAESSSNERTRGTVVNGSTLAVSTWGQAHTMKLS